MKQNFGDTNGYRLTVYPDYASLARPDPSEERRRAELHLPRRLGRPVDELGKSADDDGVDLSQFDIKAVVGVLRGAPETLGIKPADVRAPT